MLRLTNKAQALFKQEIADYEDFLMNRAMLYANQDDSIEIRDKHIAKAIRDYRNTFYYAYKERIMQEEKRRERYIPLFFAAICLILFALIVLILFNGVSSTKNVELISILGSLVSLVWVHAMYLSLTRRKRKSEESQKKIIEFLNKWNEFEAILRNRYRKKYSKDPKTFRDLINFYQIQDGVDAEDKETLHRLLISRNNMIHRSLKDINEATIDGLLVDVDNMIDQIKAIE